MLTLATCAVLCGRIPEIVKALDKLMVVINNAIAGSRHEAQGSAARLLAALVAQRPASSRCPPW